MKRLLSVLIALLVCAIVMRVKADIIGSKDGTEAARMVSRAKAAEKEKDLEKAISLWFDAFNEYQLHLEQYAPAFECAHRVVKLSGSQKADFLPRILHYYAEIAELCYEFGDFDNARVLLDYILDHPDEAYAGGALSHAYYLYGVIVAQEGDYNRAIGLFSTGMYNKYSIDADTLRAEKWYYHCKRGIAYVYALREEHEQAIPLYREAYWGAASNEDHTFLGETACLLGLSYNKIGVRDSLRHYLDKADLHYSKASCVRQRTGLLYLAKGEYESVYGNRIAGRELIQKAFVLYSARSRKLDISNIKKRQNFVVPTNDEAGSAKAVTILGAFSPWIFGSLLLFAAILWLTKRYNKRGRHLDQTEQGASPNTTEMQLYAEIEAFLEETKSYHLPDFCLCALSKRLNRNVHVVSAAINHVYGHNFRHFINERRIIDVVRLIDAGSPLTIEALGEEVGFSNRTTFWRSFTKVMGMSIEQYIKERDSRTNHI
jgi:AraC-like DNA-binding protein